MEELLIWLSQCPSLQGETLNPDYLPSYSGWSLTVMKSSVRTDILGGAVRSYTLKITRRHTVQNNADRLAVIGALENLAAWARDNPPPGTQVKLMGMPEFTARNTNGVEDISVTFTLRT